MNYEKLIEKGINFLGCKHPIIGGAMSWISTPKLVAAISNAGGFGVYACGHNTIENIKNDIDEIRKLTDKPFGVNLITISPTIKEQLDCICNLKPSHIVFAGRLPKEEMIKTTKKCGAKIMTFAPNLPAAKRMISYGADALVIEGSEAGGHVGSVSTLVLIQEVLFNITEVPVFVAGGIATGKMAAYILAMGASGIQIGTRFMLTPESDIHDKMKQELIDSEAKDAAVSFGIDRRLGVVPVRSLTNKGVEKFAELQIELVQKLNNNEITSKNATDEIERFWLGRLRTAVQEGDLEYGSLMAGNCVGMFNDIKSAKEIIDEMVNDTTKELNKIK